MNFLNDRIRQGERTLHRVLQLTERLLQLRFIFQLRERCAVQFQLRVERIQLIHRADFELRLRRFLLLLLGGEQVISSFQLFLRHAPARNGAVNFADDL